MLIFFVTSQLMIVLPGKGFSQIFLLFFISLLNQQLAYTKIYIYAVVLKGEMRMKE